MAKAKVDRVELEMVEMVEELAKKFGAEIYIDGQTVYIHKPVQPKILAHSAIKVAEIGENLFEIQASIVVRKGDESKISSIIPGSCICAYSFGEYYLTIFATGAYGIEKLRNILEPIIKLSI